METIFQSGICLVALILQIRLNDKFYSTKKSTKVLYFDVRLHRS